VLLLQKGQSRHRNNTNLHRSPGPCDSRSWRKKGLEKWGKNILRILRSLLSPSSKKERVKYSKPVAGMHTGFLLSHALELSSCHFSIYTMEWGFNIIQILTLFTDLYASQYIDINLIRDINISYEKAPSYCNICIFNSCWILICWK